MKRVFNSLVHGNPQGKRYVRPVIQGAVWGLFLGLAVASVLVNGSLWPLKGGWPSILAAAAAGVFASFGTCLLYVSALRSFVALKGTDAQEFQAVISRLRAVVLVLWLVAGWLLVRGLAIA